MVSKRTHQPGAEGAPLLANELVQGLTSGVGVARGVHDRGTSNRLVGTIAVALLVACVGTAGSIALVAKNSGNFVTHASALGSASTDVDPMEATTRPMSAYGTIDSNSPLMALASSEDPLDAASAQVLSDLQTPELVPRLDANLREIEAAEFGSASEGRKKSKKKTHPDPLSSLFDPLDSLMEIAAEELSGDEIEPEPVGLDEYAEDLEQEYVEEYEAEIKHPRRVRAAPIETAQPTQPKSLVQTEVDDAIEVEMQRLDDAQRVMDDEHVAKDRKVAQGWERKRRVSKKDLSVNDSELERMATLLDPIQTTAAAIETVTQPTQSTAETYPAQTATTQPDRTANSEVKDRYAMAASAALANAAASGESLSTVATAQPGFTAPVGEAVTLNGDGHDGSWWEMIEGQARSGRGEQPPVQGDQVAVQGSVEQGDDKQIVTTTSAIQTGTCDFKRCDAGAGPQVVDNLCVVDGGLGCLGKTGCRFCKAGGVGDPNVPTCPPCVCAELAIGGCAQPTSSAYSASSVATRTSAVAGVGFNAPDLVLAGVPAGFVAAQMPHVTLDSNVHTAASGESEAENSETDSSDVDATHANEPDSPEFSLAGVEWLLTPFGTFESCVDRCAREKKVCSDEKWPESFGDFVSVVGATAPEDGRDSICAQVLQQDVSRHCAHSVVALSGRCYFQSMHRAPSCTTEEDSHSDCQHFCPCV